MAEIKISELTSGSTLDGTEVVPIVQSGATVKVTTQDIADLGGGGGGIQGMHALTKIPGSYVGNFIVGTTVNNVNVGYGANYIYFFPFIPANDFSIDEISIEVSSVLTNNELKILIYTGDTGPANQVYESPLLDGTTAGVKAVSLNFSFNAGVIYWLGVVGSVGTQVKGTTSIGGAYQFAAQPTGTIGYTSIYYYNAGGINNIPTTISTTTATWNISGMAFFKMRVI
jgi:hypothetical protein